MRDEFIEKVADYYGVTVEEIKSKSRKGEFVRPRQVFIFIENQKDPNFRYKQMGRFLNRDHSTIIHSVMACRMDIETNRIIEKKYKELLTIYDELFAN